VISTDKDVEQCVVYYWKESDYFLGTKEIKFRLVASDPGKITEYSADWEPAIIGG
jgi:hypothetical protein